MTCIETLRAGQRMRGLLTPTGQAREQTRRRNSRVEVVRADRRSSPRTVSAMRVAIVSRVVPRADRRSASCSATERRVEATFAEFR
jgi:hypothetical protein